MKKLINALTQLKQSGDLNTKLSISRKESDLKSVEKYISDYKDAKKRYMKELADLKEQEAKAKLAKVDDKKIQEEIDKLYTLPIRSLKVVRTKSKTGYLPKILITTGMIKLANFDESQTGNPSYFKPYVGKTLGRFLIQYDWSRKNDGSPITLINLTQDAYAYQAACINGGQPCLGNIQSKVNELFAKKEFFTLTELILDYLENPLYGTPYYQWRDFFNHTRFQTKRNVESILFRDYRSRKNDVEWKVVESMIPVKELAVLTRDDSKDFKYPYVSFDGQSTDDDCHCEDCNRIRRGHAAFQEYMKTYKTAELNEDFELLINPTKNL